MTVLFYSVCFSIAVVIIIVIVVLVREDNRQEYIPKETTLDEIETGNSRPTEVYRSTPPKMPGRTSFMKPIVRKPKEKPLIAICRKIWRNRHGIK